jgi:hypothetical protein
MRFEVYILREDLYIQSDIWMRGRRTLNRREREGAWGTGVVLNLTAHANSPLERILPIDARLTRTSVYQIVTYEA